VLLRLSRQARGSGDAKAAEHGIPSHANAVLDGTSSELWVHDDGLDAQSG
jgi:hypothetical protein